MKDLNKKLKMLEEVSKTYKSRLESLKSKKIKESSNKNSISLLLEGEIERAELILTAQDMIHSLQNIAEDIGKMSIEQLMPLVDAMKGNFGPNVSERFETNVGSALAEALKAVRNARETANNEVLKLEGRLSDEDVKLPVNDMADQPEEVEDELTGPEETKDEFEGEPAAAGPKDEPLGRAKKESFSDYFNKKRLAENNSKKKVLEASKKYLSAKNKNKALTILEKQYGIPAKIIRENAISYLKSKIVIVEDLSGLEKKIVDVVKSEIQDSPEDIKDVLGIQDVSQVNIEQKQRQLANDPTVRNMSAKLNVQPQELAKILTKTQEDIKINKPILKEHRIVKNYESNMSLQDAYKVLKEKIKEIRSVKETKSLAVSETFSKDIVVNTPKSIVNQLVKKYGDSSGWSIAETQEGPYYIVSNYIPEYLKSEELTKQMQSLEEEINTIKEKHSDVEGNFYLPQQAKILEIAKKVKEYSKGYRYPVASWLTLNEAVAIITIANSLGKK